MHKEAKTLEALNHPNITKFVRVYKDRAENFNMVMEYVDGGTLADLIEEHRNAGTLMSEDEIFNFFTQICLAIKHCHDRKLLHRDIKDENIFITSRKIIKLGDFGVSKILKGTRDKALTVIGTPENMSPELLQSKPYNQKSDIWQLGMLLFKMCTLSLPWSCESIED